ncbi:MAG: hypothetical protein KGJ62_15175 [Armatimonadetes bacterium]|nr:hypothetical protein [Armatimonadota bacterium]MDE2206288.1 hypothetical protein [Armatimonadota bacterium]
MSSAVGEDAGGPMESQTAAAAERPHAGSPSVRMRPPRWYRVVHTAIGSGGGVGPWFEGDVIPAKAFSPSEEGAAVRRRLLALGAIVEAAGPPPRSAEASTDG